MQSDEKWTDNRVPWLGNVPVLRWLFKNTNNRARFENRTADLPHANDSGGDAHQ